MPGFSYKTSWLAVRERPVEAVADALGLAGRRAAGWDEGTDEAYRRGVYVVAARAGWTLAHGLHHLEPGFGPWTAGFPAWLAALSARLGEVQFFASHRGVHYVAWALARGGTLERAYAYTGDDEVVLAVGSPTPAERVLGVGAVPLDSWSEHEYDAFRASAGREEDVMHIAGAWSVGPDTLDEADVVTPGIWGEPARAGRARPAWLRRLWDRTPGR
ncbi:hypothetical protein [Dactylosporangium salmoneum]|uniref:Uncharacterized protein n=1 Tax=Dactylosporangium salmoneum TaxID=53361 RepID=A0ABP5V920_9ACTN